jgi:hypothetical protein
VLHCELVFCGTVARNISLFRDPNITRSITH